MVANTRPPPPMPTNPPPPFRVEYDHDWQDPASSNYDPLRVALETPEMKHGRKVILKPPAPPPPPPAPRYGRNPAYYTRDMIVGREQEFVEVTSLMGAEPQYVPRIPQPKPVWHA